MPRQCWLGGPAAALTLVLAVLLSSFGVQTSPAAAAENEVTWLATSDVDGTIDVTTTWDYPDGRN